jgi:hypothetical protein
MSAIKVIAGIPFSAVELYEKNMVLSFDELDKTRFFNFSEKVR